MKLLGLFLLLNVEKYMLPCLSKQLFDFDCPGCGLQRGLLFLFQGEFLAAWKMYPALFTLIPLLGFLAADQFFQIKYRNKIILTLLLASVVLILTNFIIKLI